MEIAHEVSLFLNRWLEGEEGLRVVLSQCLEIGIVGRQ